MAGKSWLLNMHKHCTPTLKSWIEIEHGGSIYAAEMMIIHYESGLFLFWEPVYQHITAYYYKEPMR